MFYMNPSADLRDPSQLSLVSYQLVRKVQSDRSLLEKVNQSPAGLESYRNCLVSDLQSNEELLSRYIDDLKKIIRIQKFDLPVHHLVQSIYSFEHSNSSDSSFYEQYIIPQIKRKLAYASFNNLAQLVVSLSKADYYNDKELWNEILKNLESKMSSPKSHEVKYSGWTLDTYEHNDCKYTRQESENEKYYSELKQGGLASLKHQFRVYSDYFKNAFLNRFFFSEARVTQTLNLFEDNVNTDDLKYALTEAEKKGINIGNVIQSLNKL
jgi:hypothetical protein